MSLPSKIHSWLETHWIAPAYAGWVLMGLTIFFFAAATNTLAGWLYVMSGVLMALLTIAAVLPPRNLRGLSIQRQLVRPVSAGESLAIELIVRNSSRTSKSMILIQDGLHPDLGEPTQTAISSVEPGASYHWRYALPTQRRGIYRWQGVILRTAAPLGLFWRRRQLEAQASATVYPYILALKDCPIINWFGHDSRQGWRQTHPRQLSQEGLTRTLRPYRWGDPMRLIHWRSSARYGELRIRELEHINAGRYLAIALNTAAIWREDAFEQAVIAAASLYMYAMKHGYSAFLWTPTIGVQHERVAILSTLAVVAPGGKRQANLPENPIVWLTTGHTSVKLPPGSRQICWQTQPVPSADVHAATCWIDPKAPLQLQLERLGQG